MTGENFDLRERIEVLNDHKKQLKLMLKTYRKKLADAGEAVPDLTTAMAAAAAASNAESGGNPESGNANHHDIMSPVVIKKEHDYLGLFEYNMNHEAEIMRALIYGECGSTNFLQNLFFLQNVFCDGTSSIRK